jgi:sugar (pentulose or hexulose) kinase
MRENLAVTEELAGPVEEAIVFGGGAKSALWREIIGDVINRPLAWTQTVETANIGAAMLAGVGSGLFSTLTQAREVMVGELAHRDPVPKNVEIYAQRYEEYRRIESVLVNQA